MPVAPRGWAVMAGLCQTYYWFRTSPELRAREWGPGVLRFVGDMAWSRHGLDWQGIREIQV